MRERANHPTYRRVRLGRFVARIRPPLTHRTRLGSLVVGLLVAMGLLATLPVSEAAPVAAVLPAEYVNITATNGLSFTPNAFTVIPGAQVHLTVTQGSNFLHTFTLSSVPGVTNLSTYTKPQLDAFLHAHPPLVNLSLGTTAGVKSSVIFVAPNPAVYEFICYIHYNSGMTGLMTSSNSTAASPAPTLSEAGLLAIGGGVAAVVLAFAWVLLRRRSHRPPDI